MNLHRIALAIAAAATAQAAKAEAVSELDEIKVYGHRPAAFRNITTSTEAVDKELIEATNVINTEDAVKYLPSIQVRKRYIGDRNAILASRNSGTIDSARSLVYADNVLVSMLLGNSFSYAPRWWFVAPQEIERVDVSYGAHSAAYAGNSVGVVMVMKSRLPDKFEAHADAQAFSQPFKLYGTNDDFNGSRLGFFLGNRHGDLRWSLSAGHLQNHSHPASFATASRSTTAAVPANTPVTGYYLDTDSTNRDRVVFGATSIDRSTQDHAKIKAAYDFSPASRLTYSVGHWRNASDVGVDSYLRDLAGNPVYAGNINIGGFRYSLADTTFQLSKREEEHWMNSLTWRYDPKKESDWAFEAALTDYDIAVDRARKSTSALALSTGAGKGLVQFLDGTGWRTADIRADWRPDGGRRGHDAAFGYHFDVHTLRDRSFASTNWLAGDATTVDSGNTGKTATAAFYVQDAMHFGPEFTLTLGLRYEQWRAFDGTRTSANQSLAYAERKENANSPKFALAWAATEDWLLRGSLSRATRFPTVTELFQGSISGTSIVNNDPNLKPEKILAGEIAAERESRSGSLRLSLFRDDLTDALTRQTNTTVTPSVTNVQNVDKARVQGIEISLRRRDVFVRGLDLRGSLTYADSEILANKNYPASVGKHMIRIPDWKATLVATWRPNEKSAWTIAGRYSGKQFNLLDNSDTNGDVFGGQSRFFVMDAKFEYRFDQRLSVSVGIDNLNNEKYFTHHPYPQRSFVIQVKGSF